MKRSSATVSWRERKEKEHICKISPDNEYEGKRIKLVIQPLDMGIGDAWALCIGISLKSVEMAVNKMIVTTLGFFSLIISLTCMLSFFLAKKNYRPDNATGR